MDKILTTVFLVSLDAIFIGITLRFQKGFRYRYLFIISAIIFTLCQISYFIAESLKQYITADLSCIIGCIFLLLALKNLLFKDNEKTGPLSDLLIILIGVIMSTDAVAATVALTLDIQLNIIPLLITAGHLIFLFLGCFTAKYIKTSQRVHQIISSLCLALVAVLNFAEVF